ncbi:MAG: UDP-N-acetylglucosamine 2-epimerase [Neomegalonema sp.]|nr:UDP-N-acetylglucosamine 2-epimerase [Neomegalonema sp.]
MSEAVKRIAVVTGTRAEYGLLSPVMRLLDADPGFELITIATCMHLAPQFGLTVDEIERDGFTVHERVDMLLAADTELAMAKSMGLGVIGIADALARQKPDLVMILGDRFEMIGVAASATLLGLPIAHLEGGHVTMGAIDDAIRHAITKLAHLHFTATQTYAARIRQMGEKPQNVFCVGATGLDNILHGPRMSREDLEASLGFAFGETNFLITFHPATLERGMSDAAQVAQMLAALEAFPQAKLIFTMPNADAGGRAILEQLQRFAGADPANRLAVPSLGWVRYLSTMSLVDAVIGNSSSGLIEAPSFGIGTVNIGTRQAGRIRAQTVLDCPVEQAAIEAAIRTALSPEFRAMAAKAVSPFGDGKAAPRIVEALRRADFSGLLVKGFVDHPAAADAGQNEGARDA